MYVSALLVHIQQAERLRRARENRLAMQAAELRRLHTIKQRAERRLRNAQRRAAELRAAIGAAS